MLTLALSEARAAAGEIVQGRVERPDDSTRVAVELVRVEHSPVGAASYHVASAELDGDGSFALAVPDDAAARRSRQRVLAALRDPRSRGS